VQAVPSRVDGRANDGGERGVDEELSADHHEGALLSGIARGRM
jgi:hypothetical protein